MNSLTDAPPSASTRDPVSVEDFFDRESQSWKEIYARDDVYSVIYQRRRQLALDWTDELELTKGVRVLDAGCGAGTLAVALATRGFRVDAVDAVDSMVELARQAAQDVGLTRRVRVEKMDVHTLGFAQDSFDVVFALGVLPWARGPRDVVFELARVTRPGGHVIASVDNRARLIHLLDPRFNPWIAPIRNAAKAGLVSCGLWRSGSPALSALHSRRGFDRVLSSAGLTPIKTATFGFGAFTFFGRPILPHGRGVAVDRHLQRLADRGLPGLRSTGAQYLVLAQKRA